MRIQDETQFERGRVSSSAVACKCTLFDVDHKGKKRSVIHAGCVIAVRCMVHVCNKQQQEGKEKSGENRGKRDKRSRSREREKKKQRKANTVREERTNNRMSRESGRKERKRERERD